MRPQSWPNRCPQVIAGRGRGRPGARPEGSVGHRVRTRGSEGHPRSRYSALASLPSTGVGREPTDDRTPAQSRAGKKSLQDTCNWQRIRSGTRRSGCGRASRQTCWTTATLWIPASRNELDGLQKYRSAPHFWEKPEICSDLLAAEGMTSDGRLDTPKPSCRFLGHVVGSGTAQIAWKRQRFVACLLTMMQEVIGASWSLLASCAYRLILTQRSGALLARTKVET